MKTRHSENLEADNVLVLRTQNESDETPHEISHPASKWYPEVSDDPLADILFEFDDAIDEESVEVSTQEIEDYIHAHNIKCDDKISINDSLCAMMDKISLQVNRIKEDTKRIKYYLDEVEDYLID